LDELRLCLVTDRRLVPDHDLVRLVRECLEAGLPAVQLREKDLPARELYGLAGELRELTRRVGARLIVNDRLDVALAVEADGVQRTTTSLPVEVMRAVADKRLHIGASVHSLDEALDAEAAGADWVIFGPVYETASKRAYGAPQGLRAVGEVARTLKIPVIAIGGVTPERVVEVRGAGAHGVAVISAIAGVPSPGAATRRFLQALESALPSPGAAP
jgi:thiamine-phosphate pyrophosphorylase